MAGTVCATYWVRSSSALLKVSPEAFNGSERVARPGGPCVWKYAYSVIVEDVPAADPEVTGPACARRAGALPGRRPAGRRAPMLGRLADRAGEDRLALVVSL